MISTDIADSANTRGISRRCHLAEQGTDENTTQKVDSPRWINCLAIFPDVAVFVAIGIVLIGAGTYFGYELWTTPPKLNAQLSQMMALVGSCLAVILLVLSGSGLCSIGIGLIRRNPRSRACVAGFAILFAAASLIAAFSGHSLLAVAGLSVAGWLALAMFNKPTRRVLRPGLKNSCKSPASTSGTPFVRLPMIGLLAVSIPMRLLGYSEISIGVMIDLIILVIVGAVLMIWIARFAAFISETLVNRMDHWLES